MSFIVRKLDWIQMSIFDLWKNQSALIALTCSLTMYYSHLLRRVYITMGKKVAVGQMNGYFLLVLADAIVPPGATECQKSWWVQAYVVGIIPPIIIGLINLPQNGDQTLRPHVFRRPCLTRLGRTGSHSSCWKMTISSFLHGARQFQSCFHCYMHCMYVAI